MQPLSIFIVESQTAKRTFLKMFEFQMIADLNWNATEWFRVVKNGGSFSPNRGGRYQIRSSGNKSRSFAVRHS
jgi:hypothetical protein